jgi:FlaA1/EpsC-like NDP-sugar epimerase
VVWICRRVRSQESRFTKCFYPLSPRSLGLRIGVRLWRNQYRIKPKLQDGSTVSRALIVGAGSLGESILRIVDRRFLGQEIHVVGFVDQSPLKGL